MPKVSKPKWRKFEKRLNIFLKKCCFDHVAGGPEFKIAGRQIDNLAVYKDSNNKEYFLIVECTSKNDPDYKDIRNKIIQFNDVKIDIGKALSENEKLPVTVYSRGKDNSYKESVELQMRNSSTIFYILALEDIDYDEDALSSAEKYGIKIWGSKYFVLSNKLANIIGEYAKYTMLKELGNIDLRYTDDGSDEYVYSGFRMDLSGEAKCCTYLFPIVPQRLLKLAYVYRRELSTPEKFEGKKLFETYQRTLIARKVNDIGENFLDGKNGFFRNNIIIVFEEEPKIDWIRQRLNVDGSASLVDIHIPKRYASIRILDGQHRLYGFLKANPWHLDKKNLIAIGIVPYGNEEAETFLSINTKQTPVDTDILWDLYSITEKSSINAVISDTVKQLNAKDPRNPFFSKIYVPSYPKGNVSSKYSLGIGNLGKTLADQNLLADTSGLRVNKYTLWKNNPLDAVENATQNVVRYYQYLKNALESEHAEWFDKFFMHNNGFNVAMRVFTEVLQFAKSNNVELRNLQDMKIGEGIIHFINKDNQGSSNLLKFTSSEGTRLEVARQIIFCIWLYNNEFGVKYLEERMDHFYSDIKDLIGELLFDLRKIVDMALIEEPDWWSRLVPEKTQEYALENEKEVDKAELKETRIYHISEGHLIEIILKLYNKYFDKYMRKHFENWQDFEKQTSIFKEKRDVELHYVPRVWKPIEIESLYDLHDKLHEVRENLEKKAQKNPNVS